MPKSLENRRRASGLRSSPSRAVQSRIDHWRLADNKIPYELGEGAFIEEVVVRDGDLVKVLREELSTTWDDTRTMNFLSASSDCSEELPPVPPVLQPGDFFLPGGLSPENTLTQGGGFSLGNTLFEGGGSFEQLNPPSLNPPSGSSIGCASWFGGWTFADWSRSSRESKLERNRRIILQNRRLVYDSSVPSAVPQETESEFSEREFLFQPFVPLVQHWKASTGHIWAGDSFVELEASARSFWLEPSGNPGVFIEQEELERLRLTDNTLGPQRVKGDLPVVDVETGRNIPWNEREFMSPFGFWNEELLEDKPGIQLVGRAGKGLEAFGFAGPNVANEHSTLFALDFKKETQQPIRARRGVGSDHFDWLPRSAKHVWLMRPALEFMQFDPLSIEAFAPAQVFEEWGSKASPTASPVGLRESEDLTSGTPNEENLHDFYAFEDFTDDYRSLKRAPRRLKNLTQRGFVDRGPLDFQRREVWTAPYDPEEKEGPGIESNRRWSSVLNGGGLFIGGVEPEILDPESPSSNRTFASGDNFVTPIEDFAREKDVFHQDEWMIEVGCSFPIGTFEFSKSHLDSEPTLSGWNTERTLLSTTVEGGINVVDATTLGAIPGEVRPRNGFSVSISTLPLFDEEDRIVTAILVANFYLVQEDQTKVARSFHVVVPDIFDGSFSCRVVAWKKGNSFGVRLQSYGINEYFDNESIEPSPFGISSLDDVKQLNVAGFTSALFGVDIVQAPVVVENFKVLDDVLVLPSIRTTRFIDEELLNEQLSDPEFNPWTRVDASSRLLFKDESRDELFSCFSGLTNYKPFGTLVGGLAVHDSYITDVNSLDAGVQRMTGLSWSNWLGTSTRRNYVNFLEFIDVQGGLPQPDGSILHTVNFTLAQFIGALNGRTSPNQIPAPFRDVSSNPRPRLLSEGVLAAQWRSGSLWNRPVEESGVGFSDEKLARPWGFSCNRLLETKADLQNEGNSRKHLFRLIDPETGELKATEPTFSSWGTRFENVRDVENPSDFVRNDYLRSREQLISDADIFKEMPTDVVGTGSEFPRNYNVCVWLNIFDVERLQAQETQNQAPTPFEFAQRIWEYDSLGKLELVSKSTGEFFLRSTTYYTDVSQDPVEPCVLEVQLTPDMLGTPLHVAFGEFTFSTPGAPTFDPQFAPRDGHQVGFLIVDDVDLKEFSSSTELSEYFLPSNSIPTGRFKFALFANNQPKDFEQRSRFIHMGQEEPELACDYVVGGVEVRQWLFDKVQTPGVLPAAFNSQNMMNFPSVGVGEPFFDSAQVPSVIGSFFTPRFPLLREWAFTRAQSLWGYTGQARILPDHYGISSIDGVGADLFSDGKFNLAGGLEEDEEEVGLAFALSGFPSLFFSDKVVDYSSERVAGYSLRKSVDRPQLYEVFDRRLARVPFEKSEQDKGVNLVRPEGRSYNSLSSGILDTRNIVPRRESTQLMRRFWYGRGVTSPIEPHPEIQFQGVDEWFSGSRVYPIYTPALKEGSEALTSINDEKENTIDSLQKVHELLGFNELITHTGTNTNFDNVFRSLSDLGEESTVYADYGGAIRYGEVEFQRLRNLSYPWVKADGSNVLLTSLPLYRDLGNETKTSELQPQEPPFYELVRVGFWERDSSDPTIVVPTPQFPTYSLLWRGEGLGSEDEPSSSYETSILGNLCFERGVTVWGFAETVNDRLLPKFDTDEGSGLPTAFRITTSDLGLVPDPLGYESDDEFLDRRVWRRLKGGRQLLRTQRGRDRLERALGAFSAFSEGEFEPFDTDVSPAEDDKRFSKAFLGKGRRGWGSAIWSVSTEEVSKQQQENRYYVDTLPPNPLTFLKEFGVNRFAYERTNKVPDLTSFPQRTKEGWKHKFMQRVIREEISGSPSPINAGLDALNPFPSLETVALNSLLFGAPRWTPYERNLQREFARTLQLAIFPNAGLDDRLLERASSLWLELTGNQAFPAWLEWARPIGGWNTRGSLDAMLPFFRYPFATVGELDKVVSFKGEQSVEAPVSIRSLADPARIFERELFAFDEEAKLATGDLLLIDRLATFDDEFPVTNLGYNYRFVRNIAGRLNADLEKQISVDLKRVEPFVLDEENGENNLQITNDDVPTPGTVDTFVLNQELTSPTQWTLTGIFTLTEIPQPYKITFLQLNEVLASSRFGIWTRVLSDAPLPDSSNFYVAAGSLAGTRISGEPRNFYEEPDLWFAETPIFVKFTGSGPDQNGVEVFAYENGDAFSGDEVSIGTGTINFQTGAFSINFELYWPDEFVPSGLEGFLGEDVEVEGEVVVDDEAGDIVLGSGVPDPFSVTDIEHYWFPAPDINDTRAGVYSELEEGEIIDVVLWIEGTGSKPEYSVWETFLLEILDEALVVLGSVSPLALQNTLNRYSSDKNLGYLRHTLANQRVSRTLLKLWYGTGDSLSRSDYVHWWRDADAFIVSQGDQEPSLSALGDFDIFTRRDVLERYNSESNEGGAFRPPNEGGNYSVWQTIEEQARFITSLRPYGPDVRVRNYQNKQHWTRDIKLQDRGRIHDVWSLRHAHPQEMMQDVTVKPRGWRYGLLDVTPSGARWAINPRHWGYSSDIVRAVPEGVTTNSTLTNLTPTVEIRVVTIGERVPQSRNTDAFYRSFSPFIETFEASVEENLLAVETLRELAQTTTKELAFSKARLYSDSLLETMTRYVAGLNAGNAEVIEEQKAETFDLFTQLNESLLNVELPTSNAFNEDWLRLRKEIRKRTDKLQELGDLTELDVNLLSSYLRELQLILSELAGVENVSPKLPTLPSTMKFNDVLTAIQTTFYR